MKTLQQDSSTS